METLNMEICSEDSVFSSEEEAVCPGPLFRMKMFVMGDFGCGLPDFIQSLIGPSLKFSDKITEGVSVSIWYPFKNSKSNEQLVGKKLTGEEHHLTIEIWNMSARQICQSVYPICLTAAAICVVVFNSSMEKNSERIFSFFRMIQQKTPRNPVFLVELQNETVDRNKIATSSGQDVLQDLTSCEESRRIGIEKEIEELKLLDKEMKMKHTGEENVSRQKNNPQGKIKQEKTDSMIKQRLECLEQSLQNIMKLPSRIYKVKISSRKGIDELKSAILDTALNRVLFPHLDRTIKQSTISLYDEILKLRETGLMMLTWEDFQQLKVKDNEDDSDDTIEEETAFLETVGGLLDFNPKSHKSKSSLPPVESNRFICIHPCHLANAICSCLVDDEKKAFRFESRHFWPKNSGFKRPDPQVLGRVLELIPQKGLIRESLFPLLWQNQSLDEDQILNTLELLSSLGVLVPYINSKDNCEGLALPNYTRLSVHRCHCATLMDLLPDNRPQLNWTVKPFKGDIQITWQFIFPMGLPMNVAKRFLAHCHFVGRRSNSYSYLWKYGVLLRLGEACICVEENEDYLNLSCRVNADEAGQEDTFVQLLWVTLSLFIQASYQFFNRECPGLFFKEALMALGQQFYCDEKIENEPVIPVIKALVMWKAAKRFVFKDGEVEKELDLNILFPFRGNDLDVSSIENWVFFVSSRRKQVLEYQTPNLVNLTSAIKKSTLPFTSLKASLKLRKKKHKGTEIKWKLDERPAIVSKPITNIQSDVKNKVSSEQHLTKTETKDPTTLTSPASSAETKTVVVFREINEEEEIKEATRIAAGFVAAIMASAVAEFISSESENNCYKKETVSAAQVAAAKVTAEAAMAAHSGDIDGAAKAVVQAVRAVQPTVNKPSPSIGQMPMKSSLCEIL